MTFSLISFDKFSRIFIALSDSKRLIIFARDSIESSCKTSLWIDSFNSINISGSILKDSISINFVLVSGLKFSIKFAFAFSFFIWNFMNWL